MSFQVLHAAARLQFGSLPLPPALEPSIRTLLTTAHEALVGVDDLLARTRARADATTEVQRASVARDQCPAPSSHSTSPDRVEARAVSDALLRLADVVHRQELVDDELAAVHTDHFSRLLRELSSTMRSGKAGRTSPGVTAAARVALRQGLPLSDDQLERLDTALAHLDDPSAWRRSSTAIDELAVSLVAYTNG